MALGGNDQGRGFLKFGEAISRNEVRDDYNMAISFSFTVSSTNIHGSHKFRYVSVFIAERRLLLPAERPVH